MGRRGPPPEPHALRVLKGTNHRTMPQATPNPRALHPDAPDLITAAAKVEWDELTEEMSHVPGWLTRVDKSVLSWRCHWYATAVELAQYLDEHGRVYESLVVHPDDKAHGGGKSEVLETAMKARPEVKMLDDAWAHLMKCDQELGLTPASRMRVQARPLGVDPADERGPDAI